MCEHKMVVLKAHRLSEIATAATIATVNPRTGYDRFGDINKQTKKKTKI